MSFPGLQNSVSHGIISHLQPITQNKYIKSIFTHRNNSTRLSRETTTQSHSMSHIYDLNHYIITLMNSYLALRMPALSCLNYWCSARLLSFPFKTKEAFRFTATNSNTSPVWIKSSRCSSSQRPCFQLRTKTMRRPV